MPFASTVTSGARIGRPAVEASQRTRGRRRTAAAAVVLALALTACSGEEPSPVQTATVARADVAEVVEAPGVVTAKATSSVSAPADGTVEALRVADGARVRAGQLLLEIDSPSARDQLEQAKDADREAAEAGRVSLPGVSITDQQRRADAAAARGFTRARDAAEALPAGPARRQALAAVDAAEAQYDAAQAQALADVRRFNAGLGSIADALGSLSQAQRVQTRAAVAIARRTVKALKVYAPVSGVVSYGGGSPDGSSPDLSGALGQLPESVRGQAGSLLGGGNGSGAVQGTLAEGAAVRSGGTLLTVTDVSTLAVTADVDETDVLLVRKGVKADVELDAVPGASYAATVGSVAVSPTTSARGGVTYGVRLALGGGRAADGSPAPLPRPGMSAVVKLKVRTAKQAVAVPAAAVFRDGARDAVWVIGAADVARKRLVSLGAQGEDMVEVSEGLKDGERIVVRGADRVTDGKPLP